MMAYIGINNTANTAAGRGITCTAFSFRCINFAITNIGTAGFNFSHKAEAVGYCGIATGPGTP